MIEQTTTSTERYSFRRWATEIRAELPISRYVADTGITELRPAGLRLVGLCMFHEEKTPSFTVYGDSSFYCFGCSATGDVIDLHAHADGHAELWTAMVSLAQRYNIELPQRSPKWFAWQKEKRNIEDLAESITFQTRCRRAFKVLILNAPEIQSIKDPAERREEIQRCWQAFQEGMRKVGR